MKTHPLSFPHTLPTWTAFFRHQYAPDAKAQLCLKILFLCVFWLNSKAVSHKSFKSAAYAEKYISYLYCFCVINYNGSVQVSLN